MKDVDGGPGAGKATEIVTPEDNALGTRSVDCLELL